jgi:hypothetical protein
MKLVSASSGSDGNSEGAAKRLVEVTEGLDTEGFKLDAEPDEFDVEGSQNRPCRRVAFGPNEFIEVMSFRSAGLSDKLLL